MNQVDNQFKLGRVAIFLLGFYFVTLLLLFLAELGIPGLQQLRATNQVLLILALLILPFLIIGMSRIIQSLTLKISGQELHIELSELRQDVSNEVDRVETNLTGQVSTAEQALWPLLAGFDPYADKRLEKKKMIVGSKQDVSQIFFASLLGEAVKSFITGAQCEVRIPNGGSLKNFADIRYRWIDMYVDFTGTCCQYFNIDHRNKSDDEIIAELNRFGKPLGLKWLPPLGASEDYCLVMKKESSEKYNVFSVKDLKVAGPGLVFTADPEFLNRDDCYIGMKNYGIEFRNVRPCRITDRYELLESGEADVFVGYETDPQLYQGNIVRLDDPDQFFPRYMAVPIVHLDTLNRIPELENALLQLYNSITTKDLITAVNKLTKFGKHPSIAKDLAREHLSKQHN